MGTILIVAEIQGGKIREASFEPVEGAEPVPVARVTLLPRDGLPLKVRWRRVAP